MKHKVFISFYHADDQQYKDKLVKCSEENNIFIDMSVNTNDIDDTDKTSERIREIIRDDYLKDSSVLIVLVGQNTKKRKHVDWEIYSSMYDGAVNKKMGILVINLPTINQSMRVAIHEEKQLLKPTKWVSLSEHFQYDNSYPYVPDRLRDNFKKGVDIAVINWNDLNVNSLKVFIDNAYKNRSTNDYDLSRPMMTRNKN